ncbi:hypothetical protein OSG_eHP4_00010 [environmental Halophage eHP-4]|nr:hypothetical protein OSG_eHP4_00010 [environmental Halophage eHP-4]
MDTNRVITGDCLEELERLEPNSVEAIVTDPPYGLAFMGRSWDDFEPKEYQEWCEKWAAKAKQVLKPGGHMLAFSGNRTHHRLFSGIQDAGFEIRDTVTFHYGSGFPKALDVSKAIDKQADAEREVVGEYSDPEKTTPRTNTPTTDGQQTYGDDERDGEDVRAITEPATKAAKKWDGFKTALKPATEFVCMARKPLGESTVAENIQEYGTGALNIDGCRVGEDTDTSRPAGDMAETQDKYGHYDGDQTNGSESGGRYPSNVVFDATEAEALDRENEHTSSDPSPRHNTEQAHNDSSKYGDASEGGWTTTGHNDSGGPSRYFYTSKATKAERTLDGKIDNTHPTVKPTDLMEWLVTLVTAENQTVLDPFCGSGTTGIACKNKNRDFLGIEQNADYADIARARIGLEPENPDTLREDNAQTGFENY